MHTWGRVLVVVASFLSIQSSAGDRIKPMIEVGAGTEAALNQGFNILLRVGFGLRQKVDDVQVGDRVGKNQLVWVHINGDFAFDPTGDATALPYMDLRVVPYHNSIAVLEDPTDPSLRVYGDLKVLPTQIGRDIRLDQDISVKVAVVGVDMAATVMRGDKLAIVAQVTADAVGIRLASHYSDAARFLGAHILTLGIEGGIAFPGLFKGEDSGLRIVIGGSGDLALGGNKGEGFALQSDLDAYLAVKADITDMIQVFLRGGYNAACNTDQKCWGSAQIMAGASVIF